MGGSLCTASSLICYLLSGRLSDVDKRVPNITIHKKLGEKVQSAPKRAVQSQNATRVRSISSRDERAVLTPPKV